MGKIKQKNWLIGITILMVISSGIVLLISMREKLGFKSCAYGDLVYISGQNIPEYNGLDNCYCSKDGSVQCGNMSDSISYSSFSSKGLMFSTRYLNYLDKEEVEDNIVSVDAGYISNNLTLVFEREVLCGTNFEPPVQVGFYKVEDGNLVVTVMTNRDPALYSRVCKVEDTFSIQDIEIPMEEGFKVYYQDELGYRYDLKVCAYKGKLFNNEAIMQTEEHTTPCMCSDGEIECTD